MDFIVDFIKDLFKDFIKDFIKEFIKDFIKDFMKDFIKDFIKELAGLGRPAGEKKKNSPFGKKSGGANRFYFRIEGNLFFFNAVVWICYTMLQVASKKWRLEFSSVEQNIGKSNILIG